MVSEWRVVGWQFNRSKINKTQNKKHKTYEH